jgi:hypothetical protein
MVAALLRQPGGFEAFGLGPVLPYSAQLFALKEPYVRERLLQRKASPMGGTTPHLPDDHDLLSRVEIFLDVKLTVPSKVQVASERAPQSSLPDISLSVGEVGGVEHLYLGMPPVFGAVQAYPVEGLNVPTSQLHVGLRHRPLSIPRWGRGASRGERVSKNRRITSGARSLIAK